jgi:hypothetical protein
LNRHFAEVAFRVLVLLTVVTSLMACREPSVAVKVDEEPPEELRAVPEPEELAQVPDLSAQVELYRAAMPRFQLALAAGSIGYLYAGRGNDPSLPLPERIRQRFSAIPNDPDPDSLVRNSHYWISNENAHYVWNKPIADIGGVFVGVGTDQVYMLAAWSKAVIIVPLDFDKAITNLHWAYGVAFSLADNPDDFRKLFGDAQKEKMLDAIKAAYPERAKVISKAYESGRAHVNNRLRAVANKYNKLGIATFVNDQAQFDYIKMLWANNRVFPVCGDLTADSTMLDLAAALRDTGMQLGVLYLSNAEHYFEFVPSYRRNIIAQPFAENGVALRTRQMTFLGVPEDGDYHYNVHPGANFQAWMKNNRIQDQYKLLRLKTDTEVKGLSVIDQEASISDPPPEIAPMP